MSAARPLVIGDRIDTDIEGANRAGMDSLLVLTGVVSLADLVELAGADPIRRPTYLAADLRALEGVMSDLRIAQDSPDAPDALGGVRRSLAVAWSQAEPSRECIADLERACRAAAGDSVLES